MQTADFTHQSNEDENNLNNIGVSYGIEPTQQSVENCDTRWRNYRGNATQVDNDTDAGTKGGKNRPLIK